MFLVSPDEPDLERSLIRHRKAPTWYIIGHEGVCFVAFDFFVPRACPLENFAHQLDEAHARALKAEEALEVSQSQSLVRYHMSRPRVVYTLLFFVVTSPVPTWWRVVASAGHSVIR